MVKGSCLSAVSKLSGCLARYHLKAGCDLEAESIMKVLISTWK